MNCYHCGHELIWGGDHDIDDVEEYDMVTNLSCPRCNAYVEVYRHSGKEVEIPSPTPDASWLDKNSE
jgi:transcription elongation factor Elf1